MPLFRRAWYGFAAATAGDRRLFAAFAVFDDDGGMTKPAARAELERGTRWVAVRSGLTVLAVLWALSTLVSVAVQFFAASLAAAAAAGNPIAAIQLSGLSSINLLVVSLFAFAFVFACVRLTRASPDSGAVTPALIAAVAFLALAIVNSAVVLTTKSDPFRAVSTDVQGELWILVAVSRVVAVASVCFALIRIAAARDRAIHRAHAVALLCLAAVDTVYPLLRLISGSQAPTSSSVRFVLLAVQIALAGLVLHLCLRSRRAIPEVEEVVPKKKKKKKKKRERALEAEEPVASEPADAPRLPAPTPAMLTLAVLLAAGAVAILPIWDSLNHPDSRARALVFSAAAAIFGFGLRRMLNTAPYGARALFGLMALIAIAYVAVTTSEIAVQRSHEIDAWPVCETTLDVQGNLVPPPAKPVTGYDGPRLPNGTPCTRAAERRDEHAQLEPNGNVQDGLVQIGIRFSGDRIRIFAGAFAIAVALIVSGLVVVRAARAVE